MAASSVLRGRRPMRRARQPWLSITISARGAVCASRCAASVRLPWFPKARVMSDEAFPFRRRSLRRRCSSRETAGDFRLPHHAADRCGRASFRDGGRGLAQGGIRACGIRAFCPFLCDGRISHGRAHVYGDLEPGPSLHGGGPHLRCGWAFSHRDDEREPRNGAPVEHLRRSARFAGAARPWVDPGVCGKQPGGA